MKEKKINSIRGSLQYKIILYVLIAIVAFITAISAGLMLQMYSYGILDDTDRIQASEIEAEMKEYYIQGKMDSIFEVVSRYINSKYDLLENIQTFEEEAVYDVNGDGILNHRDLEALIGSSDFKQYMEEKVPRDMLEDIYAYTIDIKSAYGAGYTRCSYKKNMKLISKDNQAIYDSSVYHNATSLKWYGESFIYNFFDSYQEAQNAAEDADYYFDLYSVYENEEYDYENEEEDYEVTTQDAYQYDATGHPIIENGYMLKRAFDDGDMNLQIDIGCWVTSAQALELYDADAVTERLDVYYHYRDMIVIVFILSSIICIILTILSMVHSGIKKGVEDIRLNIWEKCPTEILLAGIAAAVCFFIYCIENMWYMAEYTQFEISHRYYMIMDDVEYWCLSALAVCGYMAILLLLNNIVVKVKAKSLFKSCIIVRAWKYLFGRNGKISGWVKYIGKRIPLCWKAVIAYVIVFIVCIMLLGILISGGAGIVFPIMILAAIAITLGYAGFIVMINELHKGGKELAKGNMSHKINTKYMFGAFKEHGENLNNINESIQLAVEERMKSERMKTELITNVSHDIKTPLTSIINYVDLLEKEGIDKEPEKSYIDVLSRQSARLKKLIVDLVDASKASTGNVDMELEAMDANMLLTQAAAEYEDKMANNGMTLIVNTTAEPARIMADGRHLWRVFDNLLNNASKYAMAGTRVYAQVESRAEKVIIAFKNISKEPLNISSDDLIERFVRGDSSRNTEGSGLGLSIAKSLCSLMGAEFDIEIDGDLFKAIVTFNEAK